MTEASGRPRGRRPGRDDTRGTIRGVAAGLFEAHGYDAVSMRAIARVAGVDKALIHHYFASKADLFCQAFLGGTWAVATAASQATAGERDDIGRHLAADIVQQWRSTPEARVDAVRASPGIQSAVVGMLAREMFAPVVAALGHGNGLLRGQIAASTTLGLLLGQRSPTLTFLCAANDAAIAAALGVMLQQQLGAAASG